MPGLGTIVNVAAIVIGGLIGLLFGSFMTDKFQNSVVTACGVSTLFIGISGAMAKALVITPDGIDTTGTMMMIISLVIGTVIGELLHIEDGLEHFGEWLKEKTGNSKDNSFVNAFVTASLTVCIGAMAVVGSIQDGIYGDHSTLFAKAVLDLIIIIIMTASLGKGAIFSAVSVGIFQGVMTAVSGFIEPFLNTASLNNLSYVGSVMIFCVGINLVWGKKVRVASMLPGLIAAVICAYLPWF